MMTVKDIMTSDPACCSPATSLREAAQLMVDFDCGEIPVVDDFGSMIPVGVITDRDITCRVVAEGKNPQDLTVGDIMSTPIVSVTPENSVEECCKVLEDHQIRRVPVVDAGGKCIGIVSLADIALTAPKRDSAAVLQEVSTSTAAAANT